MVGIGGGSLTRQHNIRLGDIFVEGRRLPVQVWQDNTRLKLPEYRVLEPATNSPASSSKWTQDAI
jgi:hypothetical protein